MKLLRIVKRVGGSNWKPQSLKFETVAFYPVPDKLYDYLNQPQFRWLLDRCGYAFRSENKKRIFLHKEIARLEAFPPSETVDHVNRNLAHNEESNLRPATRSQNQANRGVDRDSTTKLKGVYWHKLIKKYGAQIKIKGRKVHLGYYELASIAALAYDDAAKKHSGSYACTNQDLRLILLTEDL